MIDIALIKCEINIRITSSFTRPNIFAKLKSVANVAYIGLLPLAPHPQRAKHSENPKRS